MPRRRRPEPIAADSTAGPADAELLSEILAGDSHALSILMDRYDRLVRYTIFRVAADRCAADPQWLDALASNAWTGFLRSLRSQPDHNKPKSVSAYLVAISRNYAISALRAHAAFKELTTDNFAKISKSAFAEDPGPAELVSNLELLSALRECLAGLPPQDQLLSQQLPAILDRRWTEAGAALGIRESTLRSKWKVILQLLQSCMKKKTGLDFAPGRSSDD